MLTYYTEKHILSIDSICFSGGGGIIKISIRSEKREVKVFLEELHSVLEDEEFNVEKNLTIIAKKKEKGKEMFSTPYTLIELEYDEYDVVERLKELTVKDYSETLIDRDDSNPPLLFVFGRDINEKQVYIKLKVKGTENKKVLCVSFHYAEEKMNFPYI